MLFLDTLKLNSFSFTSKLYPFLNIDTLTLAIPISLKFPNWTYVAFGLLSIFLIEAPVISKLLVSNVTPSLRPSIFNLFCSAVIVSCICFWSVGFRLFSNSKTTLFKLRLTSVLSLWICIFKSFVINFLSSSILIELPWY
ncbi:hypothetical protein MmmBen181_1121 [Mycoplasma mycoides subsp. mycoides]|nr:hypothetical protein MMS_A1089 [Mycoplasma mycoides subsp. mycoides SC str. Gladysdale]AME12190.1 hypothetical protein MmmBen50_1038 [Mycoplasma mycoides subsp. mycoides]AME13239.1 hypothetical protein MmmBen181_1121 [Mycoplasma mycoides subsp. mycoides]AME14222.1 hypothetical protein MmmBen326_1036 [Mycoplasma mycoides subsp. mycoides]AME15201.1 hypothetical protein MmmBen468_1009 [Mycoplasma mycoides subsp. mycoides]